MRGKTDVKLNRREKKETLDRDSSVKSGWDLSGFITRAGESSRSGKREVGLEKEEDSKS